MAPIALNPQWLNVVNAKFLINEASLSSDASLHVIEYKLFKETMLFTVSVTVSSGKSLMTHFFFKLECQSVAGPHLKIHSL